MAIEVSMAGLALFLLIVGAIVGVHPPEDKQWKIVSVTAIVAAGVLLFALTVIQAIDRNTEGAEAKAAQQKLQDSLNHTQTEFRDFRTEVVNVRKEADSPGSADKKLNNILDGLNKV